jgi:hypothetical protein
MKSLSIPHYVLLGLLAWGLPAMLVSGGSALIITICTALPVWFFSKRSNSISVGLSRNVRTDRLIIVILLTFIYLFLDAFIGREKLDINLFLAHTATRTFIDNANDTVSQGRGLIDLFGAMMVVLPFALIDTARLAPVTVRIVMWFMAIVYIFYDTGISRGYLLMAVLSIFLGRTFKVKNLFISVIVALSAFFAASSVRGDFDELAFSNPLFDGIAWPYINLGLLLESNCGKADWFNFITEFTKKFLPSFLVPKEIFSFNIEMTRCIYPSFIETVNSISIFTWLGEMYYYGPSVLTSIIAGVLLALLSRLVDARLHLMQMYSLRVFVGLMCIVLLRSRIQDVFSFLLLLFLYLAAWQTLVNYQFVNFKSKSINKILCQMQSKE